MKLKEEGGMKALREETISVAAKPKQIPAQITFIMIFM